MLCNDLSISISRLLSFLVRTKQALAHGLTRSFTVCAMLPKEKCMVLNMEHHVPSTTVDPLKMTSLRLSGYIDYTIVVAKKNGPSSGESRSTGLNLSAHCFV